MGSQELTFNVCGKLPIMYVGPNESWVSTDPGWVRLQNLYKLVTQENKCHFTFMAMYRVYVPVLGASTCKIFLKWILLSMNSLQLNNLWNFANILQNLHRPWIKVCHNFPDSNGQLVRETAAAISWWPLPSPTSTTSLTWGISSAVCWVLTASPGNW